MNQMIYLCIAFQGKHIKFGLWCNGSTTGFGSVCPGSNPGSPTENSHEESPEDYSFGDFLLYTSLKNIYVSLHRFYNVIINNN